MKELRTADIQYLAGDPPEDAPSGDGPKEYDSPSLALVDAEIFEQREIILVGGDPYKWFNGALRPLKEVFVSRGNPTDIYAFQGHTTPTAPVPFKGPFQDPA